MPKPTSPDIPKIVCTQRRSTINFGHCKLLPRKLDCNPAKITEELKEKVSQHFQEILFDGELTKKMYADYRRRLELIIQYEGVRIPDGRPQKSTGKKIAISLS